MAHAIGAACIDVMDKSCTEVCPVDCIYEGGRKLYINPVECIDCGACIPSCPVEAITVINSQTEGMVELDNATFFTTVLSGRDEPVGNPGGVSFAGVIGVDTELVSAYQTD